MRVLDYEALLHREVRPPRWRYRHIAKAIAVVGISAAVSTGVGFVAALCAITVRDALVQSAAPAVSERTVQWLQGGAR